MNKAALANAETLDPRGYQILKVANGWVIHGALFNGPMVAVWVPIAVAQTPMQVLQFMGDEICDDDPVKFMMVGEQPAKLAGSEVTPELVEALVFLTGKYLKNAGTDHEFVGTSTVEGMDNPYGESWRAVHHWLKMRTGGEDESHREDNPAA